MFFRVPSNPKHPMINVGKSRSWGFSFPANPQVPHPGGMLSILLWPHSTARPLPRCRGVPRASLAMQPLHWEPLTPVLPLLQRKTRTPPLVPENNFSSVSSGKNIPVLPASHTSRYRQAGCLPCQPREPWGRARQQHHGHNPWTGRNQPHTAPAPPGALPTELLQGKMIKLPVSPPEQWEGSWGLPPLHPHSPSPDFGVQGPQSIPGFPGSPVGYKEPCCACRTLGHSETPKRRPKSCRGVE